MPSQVDRKAVSEESQDTGGGSPPSSSDKTDLEIRQAKRLTAHLKIQGLLRQK